MPIENETRFSGVGGASLEVKGAILGGPPVLRFSYKGTGGSLLLLILKNLFLTLVTLGIYLPWARTARRKYAWRSIDVAGQALDYTGTGQELFVGYLKVGAAYLVLIGLPQLVGKFIAPAVGVALQVVGAIVILLILPYAIYWSRSYLLGRTRWRGIRFGLDGQVRPFAKLWLKGWLLTVVTLGFYGPIFANQVHAAIIRDTRYGTGAFSYDGPDREAFRIGIKGFFLSILTLGIYSFWYAAAISRFRMQHTRFDRASVRFDVTGGFLLKVTLLNLVLNLVTLGIAFPWTVTYTLREVLARLTLEGPIDFSQIMQKAVSGDAAGDTLASALGVELGV